VRGLGLMTGVEVNVDPVKVETDCLEKGLCISTAGSNTLRLVPPLVITKKQIDQGLEILKSTLNNC